MNVFFDNCTSPILATTLHGYIQNFGYAAFHIKDMPGLPNGRDSADLEWIELLRRATDRWIFVTGDLRMTKNAAERAALRSAGLHGFVLAPGFQKTRLNQTAATLVWRWPDLEKVVDVVSAPALFQIPIGRNSKLRQLAF